MRVVVFDHVFIFALEPSGIKTTRMSALPLFATFDGGLRALPKSNYRTQSVLKVANNTRKAFWSTICAHLPPPASVSADVKMAFSVFFEIIEEEHPDEGRELSCSKQAIDII